MMKKMVEFKAYGGRALRVAIGIMTLVLVMAGGAGATKFITNDAKGGDCTSFGTWNAATMTCTMTTDLTEGIQIDSNGVTLDGNGHTINGNHLNFFESGIYLSGRSGVIIKNLNIIHFAWGVNLFNSSNNYIIGINASNNKQGIYLYSSSNGNTLSGNNANSNNGGGIGSGGSSNNITLSGNNANSNNGSGISLSGSGNTLSGNNANSNNYGIYLGFSSNNTLIGNNANSNNGSGIVLRGSNNTLSGNNANSNNDYGISLGGSNNTLSDNNFSSNNLYGISLGGSDNTLSGNNASFNERGIMLSGSGNKLSGNNASFNNDYGIDLSYSNNSMLSGNNATFNNHSGIYLGFSSNNTLIGNNANSNKHNGIYLSSSSNNTIYNNFFINNNNFESSTSVNKWNTTKTPGTNIIGGPYIGGNFWANPGGTGFSQTCPDADGDGLCNSIYTLDSYNIDYLPLSLNFSIDNISPASITNLTNITYAPTYINWTWTNPPDPDFNHVMLFLNSTFLTNITAPQNYYNATGLLPDTSYELGTHTVDTAGNINETWVNDTASTLPASGTTLNLYTGWNLISLPLMSEDTSISSVLSPISGNYSIVWAYNASNTADHWKKFDPSAPFGNDLTSMEPGKGYWIMMTNNDILPIIGTVPESIDLKIGWNLMGYNSPASQPITDALSSINGNYSIVWAYNANDTADHWKKYDPSAPFGNDLSIMEPGNGYWIMMILDDILLKGE